jgi:hypothetical protein
MAFLVILGLLVLIAVVLLIRHSRGFRGYGEHYSSEEQPQVKLSKLPPGSDGGSF